MRNRSVQALCEAAMSVALSFALCYLKIPIGAEFGGFGGSVDLVMLPLILCAWRWGLWWGMGAGLALGTLKFFLAGGFALTWQSMLLDYTVAYMFVGLAGLIRRKPRLLWLSALLGCTARFFVHYLSGITIYAAYMSDIFGLHMTSVSIYSLLYNATYMLPNTLLAVLICALLAPLTKKLSQN